MKPVVNSKLLNQQRNGELEPPILTSVQGHGGSPAVTLVHPAARSFHVMAAAALADDVVLLTERESDSYRPLVVQQQIFDDRYTTDPTGFDCRTCGGVRFCKKFSHLITAACPGTSNHGLGQAVDLVTGQAMLAWLRAHADGFGWTQPAGPNASIRYTAIVKDGRWHEVGERVAEGQAPVKTFEMRLSRIGATGWPQDGAVTPR